MSNLKELSLLNSNLKSSESSQDRISKFCRSLFLKSLSKIEEGTLTIQDLDSQITMGKVSSTAPNVHLKVHSYDFYVDVVTGGSVGAAESYVRGDWDCGNLCDLTRLMIVNREVLDQLDSRFLTFFKNALAKVIHSFRRNSKEGSRKNIGAHYDLGNDFFELMLDDTMMYSSGIFEKADSSLKEAVRAGAASQFMRQSITAAGLRP